jgi:tetratricopeptide (TPR) repeat protein
VIATLLGLLTLLGIGAPQTNPAPPPALVLPFSVDAAAGTSGLAGAPYWFGEAAAIALTDELGALGVTAASREERVGVFESLQLPMSAPLTRATIIRTGELMGASAIIVGDIRLADRLSVRAHVIDLASGRQWPDVTADGSPAEFFDVLARIARGLSAHLPTDGPIVTIGPRPSVDAFEDYVKGLVATSPDVQVRFLEAALTHAPNDPRTLMAMWHARTAQGDHAKALAVVARVAPTARESRAARFLAAQSMMALKRFDEAFKALDALYKEAPAAGISNALGVLQLRRGGTPTGGSPAFFFNRAVDEALGDPEIAFNLGYAYALAGDAASAVYWLREVVRRQPADGAAHLVLSAMLATQAKPVEAQREFDLAKMLGAVEGTPALPSDKVARGLERLQPELITAVPRQTVVPQEHDQTASFYLDRGRRLAEELRDREAIDELHRAIYVSPYLDQPHLLLGRIYQRTGRLTEASEEFTLALWCQETDDAHAGLSSVQLAMGKRDAARASATRAVALNPTNVEAREVLRQLGGDVKIAVSPWLTTVSTRSN